MGAITATTLSWVTSFCMALAASAASLLLSATIRVSCLPSTPPLALTSLIASLAPLAADWPKVALPPVISRSAPIFITSAACFFSPPQPAIITVAKSRTRHNPRTGNFLFIPSPPIPNRIVHCGRLLGRHPSVSRAVLPGGHGPETDRNPGCVFQPAAIVAGGKTARSTVIICTIGGSVNAPGRDSAPECPSVTDPLFSQAATKVEKSGIRLLSSYSAIGINGLRI